MKPLTIILTYLTVIGFFLFDILIMLVLIEDDLRRVIRLLPT